MIKAKQFNYNSQRGSRFQAYTGSQKAQNFTSVPNNPLMVVDTVDWDRVGVKVT
ncbi:hypothetical protein ADIS_2480 [Lunatimonas lonarensis]|uniref:Uncharacterized protein n=1 Tax=Lunatimonas lonarensis TaxID=1232681 RepID=R7ZSB8_9BACT|nr:hypothetical protein ADIS_2480 [Lunatimonas lonarensis]